MAMRITIWGLKIRQLASIYTYKSTWIFFVLKRITLRNQSSRILHVYRSFILGNKIVNIVAFLWTTAKELSAMNIIKQILSHSIITNVKIHPYIFQTIYWFYCVHHWKRIRCSLCQSKFNQMILPPQEEWAQYFE